MCANKVRKLIFTLGLTHAIVEELIDGSLGATDEVGHDQPSAQTDTVEAEETHNLRYDQNGVEYISSEAS